MLAWPLAFALVGLIWVTVTDNLLAIIVDQPALFARLQTYKEWFFVLVAAALGGWMMFRLRRRLHDRLVHLEAILDSSRDALCVIQNDRLVLANPAFQRLFGYEREREVLGRSIEDFLSDEGDESLASLLSFAAHPEGREGLHLNGKKKAGSVFPVAVNLGPLALGNERYAVATIRAFGTDTASADDTEPDPAALMRAIVDSMPQPLLACDRRGRWQVHNRQARRLLSLPEEALPTDRLPVSLHVCHSDGRPLPAEQLPTTKAMNSGTPQLARLQIHLGAGVSDRHEITANAYPLRKSGGETLGAAMLIATEPGPRQSPVPGATDGIDRLYMQALLADELETCAGVLVDWLTPTSDAWMAVNVLDPTAGRGICYERRAPDRAPFLCCHRYETKRAAASDTAVRPEICDLDHLPSPEQAPALRHLLATAGVDSYLRIPLALGTPTITVLIACSGAEVSKRLEERLPEGVRETIGKRLAELWQRRSSGESQHPASADGLASDRLSTS